MTNTPTPRTDAAVCRYTGGEVVTFPRGLEPVVPITFARQLETELAQMRRQRDMVISMLTENVTFTDEQLKEAGCGVGLNIEIRHDLPIAQRNLAALQKVAREMAFQLYLTYKIINTTVNVSCLNDYAVLSPEVKGPQ